MSTGRLTQPGFLTFLADAVLVLHVLYVAFVVLGFAAILGGALLRRRWARNPLFRYAHLGAIGLVATQAIAGVPCPLTVWERDLRRAAGQTASDLDFIPRLLRSLIFFEASDLFFLLLYVGFTGIVILSLFLVPPAPIRRGR